jgi:hypothetical protein
VLRRSTVFLAVGWTGFNDLLLTPGLRLLIETSILSMYSTSTGHEDPLINIVLHKTAITLQSISKYFIKQSPRFRARRHMLAITGLFSIV